MADTRVPVRVAGLTKRFDEVTALDGVDLSASVPEILGIAGPNGSGKTTLIRCLLGLLEPTSGRITIGGTTPRRLSRGDRARIGYMPQRAALYDDLTVRENVAFFARLYAVEDRADAVDRALGLVDLRDREADRVAVLSGGMIRRTSLACAVVHRPDLLILDEPTVGLDPKLRSEMWDTFRTWREEGTTVVLSTHYLGEVDRCNRVMFLREGRVIAIDEPMALRDRTATNTLEAAFLALLEREEAPSEDLSRVGDR